MSRPDLFAAVLLSVDFLPPAGGAAAPPDAADVEAPAAREAVRVSVGQPAPATKVRVWTGERRDDASKVYRTVLETEKVIAVPGPDGAERLISTDFPSRVSLVGGEASAELRAAAAALPYHNPVRAGKVRDLLANGSNREAGVTGARVSGIDLSMLDVRERTAGEGGGTEFRVAAMVGVAPSGALKQGGATQSADGRCELWVLKDGVMTLEKDELAFEFVFFP